MYFDSGFVKTHNRAAEANSGGPRPARPCAGSCRRRPGWRLPCQGGPDSGGTAVARVAAATPFLAVQTSPSVGPDGRWELRAWQLPSSWPGLWRQEGLDKRSDGRPCGRQRRYPWGEGCPETRFQVKWFGFSDLVRWSAQAGMERTASGLPAPRCPCSCFDASWQGRANGLPLDRTTTACMLTAYSGLIYDSCGH